MCISLHMLGDNSAHWPQLLKPSYELPIELTAVYTSLLGSNVHSTKHPTNHNVQARTQQASRLCVSERDCTLPIICPLPLPS